MSTNDWFDFEPGDPIANGIYEIEGSSEHFDPELQEGQIELYDHPERGQSYWDQYGDDGTDYAGHLSPFYLGRCRLRLVKATQP